MTTVEPASPNSPSTSARSSARTASVAFLGDHDALARGEPVGLDHVRGPERIERAERLRHRRGAQGPRRRDAVPLAQVLRPRLGALEPRPLGRRPEHRVSACRELVGQTGDERTFGTDDREVDAFAFDEGEQAIGVVGGDVVDTTRPARSPGSPAPPALGRPRDRGRAATRARARARRPRPPGPSSRGRGGTTAAPRGRDHPTSAVRLCSRPGPTETTPTGTPTSSWIRSRYFRAAAGRSPNDVAPPISSSQPSSSS